MRAHEFITEDDNIDSSKVSRLLWSLSGYLKKAMPDVEIDQRSGGKVWTRGDGTRYRDPAALSFQDVATRDQAFDLLAKALTGARRTTVSGEHGSDEQQDALVWKGKVIAKKGSFSISLGSSSRITNPNSAWREKNEAVEENFADGKVKGKSRPGRVKAAGASCKGSVTSLRQKAKQGGEKGKMYHWCANMKAGRNK